MVRGDKPLILLVLIPTFLSGDLSQQRLSQWFSGRTCLRRYWCHTSKLVFNFYCIINYNGNNLSHNIEPFCYSIF